MAELADIYEQLRTEISELVAGLEPDQLDTPVPATPGWTIKDVITHITADASCVIVGDFPSQYFETFGEGPAVELVNDWTARQVNEREGHSLEELLQEWKSSATELTAMMRGEKKWSENMLPFVDSVIVTDAAVHQQDIFGALGIERARENTGIRIGLAAYVVGIGWRLAVAKLPPVGFDVGDKTYVAGEGEPETTVRASRYELFRAMSGRRNPEQIAAFDWDGDPEPYIPYFYPYGIRKDALVE
jgi:uncharacterized protein (TIGR03083 family)